MVGIVNGNALGLDSGLLNQALGQTQYGQDPTTVGVNAATGNLVIQDSIQTLTDNGEGLALFDTYNSNGQTQGDQGWLLGATSHVSLLSGTIGQPGSSVALTLPDGSQITYTYSSAEACYVSTESTASNGMLTAVSTALPSTLTLNQVTQTANVQDGSTTLYTLAKTGTAAGAMASAGATLASTTATATMILRAGSSAMAEVGIAQNGAFGAATTVQILSGPGSVTQDVATGAWIVAGLSASQDTVVQISRTDLTAGVASSVVVYPGGAACTTANASVVAGGLQLTAGLSANGLVSTPYNWVYTDPRTQTTYTYDQMGRLVAVTDVAGNSNSYRYTGNTTQLATIIDASGESCQFGYNAAGQLQTLTSVLAIGTVYKQVSYGYDTLGRLQTVTVAPNQAGGNTYVTTYGYVGTTNLVNSLQQSDGTKLSFAYVQNSSGQWLVNTVTDGDNNVTTFSQAATSTGGSMTVTNQDGYQAIYQYNTAGLVTGVQLQITPNPAAQFVTTGYKYDSDGNLLTVTNANGGITQNTYNALNQLLQSTDPAGNVTGYIYSPVGQLLAKTVYPNASTPETTRFVYNSQGQLRFAVGATGDVTEYRYNAGGQRVSEIRYTAAQYNVSGLAATATLSYATMSAWQASLGARVLMTAQRTDYGYDFRGNVQSQTVYGSCNASGLGVGGTTTSYIYDAAGRLLQTVNADQGTTQYGYDALGRVLSKSTPLGATTSVAYNDAAHQIVTTHANGLITTDLLDADGNVLSSTQSGSTGSNETSTNYYNGEGQLRASVDAAGNASWFFYDGAGRQVGKIDA
ncbi:MAG: RHS repeat protein, partial [Burkholderiales bacterium]|nr:RHS repeat protein [Burkholderiales bacterium]